jgi:hypothetical protein
MKGVLEPKKKGQCNGKKGWLEDNAALLGHCVWTKVQKVGEEEGINHKVTSSSSKIGCSSITFSAQLTR